MDCGGGCGGGADVLFIRGGLRSRLILLDFFLLLLSRERVRSRLLLRGERDLERESDR